MAKHEKHDGRCEGAATGGARRRVLLIGWDAADWKMINPLLEQGHMPCLAKLIDRGVMGNIASLTPMLSPMLWTSIVTGKHADKHGIMGFAEPNPAHPEVAAALGHASPAGGENEKNAGPAMRPVTSTSRQCKALWNILSERGKRSVVLNWFASQPAERINGVIVTDRFAHAVATPDKDWPAVPGSVHPAELLEELCELRVHPASTTPMQVAPFIPKLAEKEPGFDPLKDQGVHELRVLLAQCASVHAAAVALMDDDTFGGWDFFAVYYDTIDRFAHEFMQYHPPKMNHVLDEEFERYKDVMIGCYRFHDMMLARLLELAGSETTVVLLSDHGFHSDHLRPEGSSAIKDGQPVAWHRQHGIVVIAGPGIKEDERVYGASLLDITPTILHLFGLPVAKDMDGNALTQIQLEPTSLEMIETYEGGDDDGIVASEASVSETDEDDPWVAQQVLDQLAQLGYIDPNASLDGLLCDRLRNLGQVYSSTGRAKLAIEQFEQVLQKQPEDKGAKMAIASCLMQLGRLDECETMAHEVMNGEEDTPRAHLYMGMICFRRDQPEEALSHLLKAEQTDAMMPGLHVQIGQVYLRRQQWEDAERAFSKALDSNPDDAEAHDGLGVVYRAQGKSAEAVEEHMRSVALQHHRPQTHIHLGLALAEVGEIDWAIRAFNVAIEQNPRNPLPHRCLAQLYSHAQWDAEKAEAHRVKAEELRTALSTDKSE